MRCHWLYCCSKLTYVTQLQDVVKRGLIHCHLSGDPTQGRGGEPEQLPEAQALWDQQAKDYEAAAEGAHCIVFNMFGIHGWHLAKAKNIPCVASWLTPFNRTRSFASFMHHSPQ